MFTVLSLPFYYNVKNSESFKFKSGLINNVSPDLNLNDSEFFILLFGSSSQYFHELADIFAKLLLYSNKLCIDITISRSSALSVSALFILLMQLVNGAQFLKTTC